MTVPPLALATLADAYRDGALTPAHVLYAIHATVAAGSLNPVWIVLQPKEITLAKLAAAEATGRPLPLKGVPFAVKDNIDVAGLPTTAACPAFAYQPPQSATVVERLEAAGAMLIGKTNLDQFATGLVGVRSPFGAPSCVFDSAYISGGSSSGSAVAVASGLVSFALGTDTAGSGRVPAAFNNIVGLKPTRGLISAAGVVPACRTLDCVSIFAGSADDAAAILAVAQGPDPRDCLSRAAVPTRSPFTGTGAFRFGVPAEPLEFFGDVEAAALHDAAVERMIALGGERVAIDFTPFARAAELLYQGPWVAERLAALVALGFTQWDQMDPTVKVITEGARGISAVDTFTGLYELAEQIRRAAPVWDAIDILLLPTAGTIYRIEAVRADPIRLNSTLGRYTNFVNLMDLSAIAVPAGFRPNGLPYGVTLIGPAFADVALARLARRVHDSLGLVEVGATGYAPPAARWTIEPLSPRIALAVVGAHLEGQPLNHQLTTRRATKLRTTRTATGYRLLALSGTMPAKPGLVRDAGAAGHIEVEIWELDEAAFGSFAAEVPPPLAIGSLELEDGSWVKGFVCEPCAVAAARDITEFGGWRNWLAASAGQGVGA